jgi:hypothetical protein
MTPPDVRKPTSPAAWWVTARVPADEQGARRSATEGAPCQGCVATSPSTYNRMKTAVIGERCGFAVYNRSLIATRVSFRLPS